MSQLYQKAETAKTGMDDTEKALMEHGELLKENHGNTKQAVAELQENGELLVNQRGTSVK